ncbi:MMPL family transporter, partial [Exiguobacterium sp. UBA6309]
MRQIVKWRWAILALLLIVTVGLLFTAPNLAKQAEDAGAIQLANDADSQRAADILEKAGASEETISLVIPLKDKVSDADRKSIGQIVQDLEALDRPVTDVLDPFENKETEGQLVSKDKKTVLVPITVDGSQEEIVKLAKQIRTDLLPKDQTIYLTGEALINDDV